MFVTLSEVEMRLYSLQMAFDSAQADTTNPFETASSKTNQKNPYCLTYFYCPFRLTSIEDFFGKNYIENSIFIYGIDLIIFHIFRQSK